MATTNLSKIRREKMLSTINEIKKGISDEEILNNLSLIENELTKKKFGLIWEEHEERVDKELETQTNTKSIQGLVEESIQDIPDLTGLDDVEQDQIRQQRAIIEQRNGQNQSQNIGD